MPAQVDGSLSGSTRSSIPAAGSEPEIIEKYEEETPTASHALAEEGAGSEPDEKGASQAQHEAIEVKDLGWNDDTHKIPQPVIGGLKNEDLWTMLRRFDKQIFHVKRINERPLADLDLNIADEEEFSPDKLRAQVERLYMVVIVNLFSVWKQIVRLRSWREWQRTSIFLAVYSVAWLLDILIPTFAGFLIMLILYPPSREKCFPFAPPALIDANTGGVQKPAAGVLASDDSVTGAPEHHQGEAVEKEAHSFVNSFSTLVISTAAGKHPQGDPNGDNFAVPDPTEIAADVAYSKDKTNGENTTIEHDRTKKPIEKAVWGKARPAMHAIGDLVDTWERFGNALSPTQPFPRRRPRLTLAACLLPVLLGSYLTTSYMMLKGLGFCIGFGFFGDPIITRGLAALNENFPDWQKHLQLRHTILRGIPTNAQLVITLLRIGEKNKSPIPPPPTSNVAPPVVPHATAGQNLDHLEGVTNEEINETIQPDPDFEEGKDEKQGKPKKARRILNLLKGTTRGGVHTALTTDKVKAAAGASHARNRLGVVKGNRSTPERGPVCFPARYKGKKGHAYVTMTAATPAISWTTNIDDSLPVWSVTIADIEELKKVGGLGWKSKILVGWAMGSEIVDGLLIKTKGGDELHLTAIIKRDDLFNRLIAIGSQMWEAW